jgi:hypothetical protein
LRTVIAAAAAIERRATRCFSAEMAEGAAVAAPVSLELETEGVIAFLEAVS